MSSDGPDARRRRRTGLQSGHDHKTLRSRTDVVSRVACDQGQTRVIRGPDYRKFIRTNNHSLAHGITELMTCAPDQNFISLVQLMESPEERVAVTRYHGITGITWPYGLLQMSWG